MLSDEKRRALYDAGVYDPLEDGQEEVEVITEFVMTRPRIFSHGRSSNSEHAFLYGQGFHDFLQEMLSLMATVGREVSY